MYKPRISREEFKRFRQSLVVHNFSERERDRIEEIFRGDLDESGDFSGIDAGELERGIKYLREHKSSHNFSDEQIDLVEKELRERL